jgi:hypothetical protein
MSRGGRDSSSTGGFESTAGHRYGSRGETSGTRAGDRGLGGRPEQVRDSSDKGLTKIEALSRAERIDAAKLKVDPQDAARDAASGARNRKSESARERQQDKWDPKPGKLEKTVRQEGERIQLRQATQDPASNWKLRESIKELLQKSTDALATLNMDKVGHLKHALPR